MPVLTLASRRSPSHTGRSLSADSHTPRPTMVCFHGRSIVPRPYNVRLLLKLPSAQSPFAHSRCYLSRHGVSHHVSGCYPTFIAPTGSCVNPPPSSDLGATLGPQVCAGCCQPLLGGGPSRRCSAHLSLRAWTPTPAALEVLLPVSSLTTSAFPPFGP